MNAELKREYENCVRRFGLNAATDAIQKVTGHIFVGRVADAAVQDVITALKAPRSLANALAEIGEKAFAAR